MKNKKMHLKCIKECIKNTNAFKKMHKKYSRMNEKALSKKQPKINKK